MKALFPDLVFRENALRGHVRADQHRGLSTRALLSPAERGALAQDDRISRENGKRRESRRSVLFIFIIPQAI